MSPHSALFAAVWELGNLGGRALGHSIAQQSVPISLMLHMAYLSPFLEKSYLAGFKGVSARSPGNDDDYHSGSDCFFVKWQKRTCRDRYYTLA